MKHNLDKGLLRMSVHVGWEARDRKEGRWVQDDPVKAPADTNRLSRPALLSAPGQLDRSPSPRLDAHLLDQHFYPAALGVNCAPSQVDRLPKGLRQEEM